MPVFTESLLVIDNGPKFDSIPLNALSSLGYRSIEHAGFDHGARAFTGLPRIDAIVVYWANGLPAEFVAETIRTAMTYSACEAALMISSYCTEANVGLLRRAGVAAWVTVPFTRRDLAARLRYTLEGERRVISRPVSIERRFRAPMPAFA